MEDDDREMVEGAMLLHEVQPATFAASLETPELLLALVRFGTAIWDLFPHSLHLLIFLFPPYVTLKINIS